MTIRDAQTTFIKTYQDGLAIPHGIPIDIFPLDGAPKGNFQRKKQNLGINLCFILFTSGTRKTWWHFSNGESGIIEYLSIEKVRYHIWRFAEKE